MNNTELMIKRLQNDIKMLQNINKNLTNQNKFLVNQLSGKFEQIPEQDAKKHTTEQESTQESKLQESSNPVQIQSIPTHIPIRIPARIPHHFKSQMSIQIKPKVESHISHLKKQYNKTFTCNVCNTKYNSFDGDCYTGHCHYYPRYYE